MTAKIFQLELVKKDEYEEYDFKKLDSSTFDNKMAFPDPTMIYWWGDAEDIKDSFSKLVSDLPNGMFDVNEEEMSLTYVKRPDNAIQEYFDKIKEKANELTIDNYYDGNDCLFELEMFIKQGGYNDMIYNCIDGYPSYLKDWILWVATVCKIGTKYYLGGILDVTGEI